MEMMAEKIREGRLHIIFGEYCIVHSIFVFLSMYVNGFRDGFIDNGFFSFLIIYSVAVFFIDFLFTMTKPTKPDLYTAYNTLIGCCEGITVVSILFPSSADSNCYAAAAILGAASGLMAIYFNTPEALSFNYRFLFSELLSWIIYGLTIGWISSFLLCTDTASVNTEFISLWCFVLSGIGSGLTYIILSCIQKRQDRTYSKTFEAERDKINREQDIYAEEIARSKAEKENREREREAHEEHAKKEREERNRRQYYRYDNYNRSSS